MLRPVPRSYRTPGGRVYKLYQYLSTLPHLLIAGATGSGKSVTLNGIIYAILATRSPFESQFVFIDPKKVELVQYADLPHTIKYASEPSEFSEALDAALRETERRFSLMQAARVKDFDGPHLYVVIDELADLMVSHKAVTLPQLQRLAQIGRAARVHVIACSQNIMAQTIPTVLKCNFTTILGLRTATAQQSRFLIAAPGCERLPNPQRTHTAAAFLRDGADLERVDLYMYAEEDLHSMINYWTSSACIAV